MTPPDTCDLAAARCTPCQGGIPPLDADAAALLLQQTPGWALRDEGRWIYRRFAFANFVDALAFANQVGALCEEQGHHADLRLGWGYCTVEFQTHKIGGLHANDFVMAAGVNRLAGA